MTADGKRRRLPLRWLTLAEMVGVLALVVAALSYWDSHRERVQQDQERAQAARERESAAAAEARVRQAQLQAGASRIGFLMTGQPEAGGERLRLQAARPEQVIQTQTLWFPTLVRADSVSTTGNPRIEAGWIESGLRRSGGTGGGRVPVAVETVFIEDGQTRTDRAVYLVGYSLHGRMIGGPRVTLEGLSLARGRAAGDLQAAANGFWIGRR